MNVDIKVIATVCEYGYANGNASFGFVVAWYGPFTHIYTYKGE